MHRVLNISESGVVVGLLFFFCFFVFFCCFFVVWLIINNNRSYRRFTRQSEVGTHLAKEALFINNINLPFQYKYMRKWTVTMTEPLGTSGKRHWDLLFFLFFFLFLLQLHDVQQRDMMSWWQFATSLNIFSDCKDTWWGTRERLITTPRWTRTQRGHVFRCANENCKAGFENLIQWTEVDVEKGGGAGRKEGEVGGGASKRRAPA